MSFTFGARRGAISAIGFAAAIELAALLGAGVLAGEPPAPAERVSSADPARPEIRIRPRVVYRRCRYGLEVALPREVSESAISWKASAGRLIRRLGRRVEWQAPEGAGRARISVQVTGTGGGAIAVPDLDIDVREPSREGLVLIPGGTFLMGDSWTDTRNPRFNATDQNKHDRPAHPVHLDAFYIDRFKVTNRRYVKFLEEAMAEGGAWITERDVMGNFEGSPAPFYRFSLEPAAAPPHELPTLQGEIKWDGKRLRIADGCEEHPVVDVTWLGAAAFAAHYGLRLPTEAEWEKAARGTDGRRYPWGNELPTRHHANLNGHYDAPTPVGKFSPLGDSPYGLCDMLGVCHEWVNDWFNDDIFADLASPAPVRNPPGPEWGNDHVVRGLSRVDHSLATLQERSPLSFRYSWALEFAFGDGFAHAHTGFRTALSP